MRELDETKKYNIKNLSDKELLEVIEWLRKNDRGWEYVNLADLAGEKTLYFDGGEWLTSFELEDGEVNAKELFYTLENIQVDCRELSEEQIREIVDVFKVNGYKIWNNPKALNVSDVNYLLEFTSIEVFVSIGSEKKTTITYEKFMELFSNKEENFKKLVEVLNEELTEEYNKPEYEVTMIAEQPTHPSIAILDKAVELSNELKAYKETSNLERAEEIFNPQQHYSNELKQFRSLYELSHILKLNEWEFDILKRLVRCRKKNQFKEDLQKIKDTIDIYLNEFTDEK